MNKIQNLKSKINDVVDKIHWPKDTAGRKMTAKVPMVKLGETLDEVRAMLFDRAGEIETMNYVYVIDDNKKLLGVFSIKEIFKYPTDTSVRRIMKKVTIRVAPKMDQERVAYLALKHNLKAIPVVSEDNVLLGVVPSDKILAILNKEASEDIYHLAGVFRPEFCLGNCLEIPIIRSVRYRIPWLLIGLAGGILAAWIIGLFEASLKENLILAMFIPVIVYMSNAVGIQAQTLFIRDLAIHRKLAMRNYFLRQLIICGLVGVACSVLLFLIVSFGWASAHIGFVLAISMLVAVIVSAFFALFIPYLLNKFKSDPALGSGPFATIVQDILSIIIYFGIASWLL